MPSLLGVLLVLTIGAIQSRSLAQPLVSDAEIQKILHRRIDDEKQSIGIVVGLVDEQGSHTISYGRLNQTDSRPTNGDTLFEIGSVTKVFTTLLLADRVQKGEMRLTDPVSRFLPPSVHVPSYQGKQITLQDLATHTSGLPRLPDNLHPKDVTNPYADYTIAQLYAFLSNYHLTRAIGAKYEYSNLGMGLLGHLLSLQAGTDYETLVVRRICQPLQMQSTRIQLTPELQTRLATGHTADGQPTPSWDLPTLAGRSTANDLLKLVAANLGLTPSALLSAMQLTHQVRHHTENPNLKIGLGWHVFTQYGRTILWHDGETGGFSSFIGFDPKQRRGVVVLSNTANAVADIGLHVLDKRYPLVTRKPPKVHIAIALDAKIYDAYVGQYELAPGFILTITKEQDQLYLQATGQPKVQLFPESETEFFMKAVDAQVTFVKNPAGQVAHLVLHQNGQHLPAKRIR
ncbi:MAG: serine hydrolase [Scytolyngbya sp. HA4215-MV1]|nr:serine hydrolase [Scytolyngbya sp. HA4215-MV1]